jgi:hypothetical protein
MEWLKKGRVHSISILDTCFNSVLHSNILM